MKRECCALVDAVRLGFCHYPYLAYRAPMFASPRGHPRFQSMLATVRARWKGRETAALRAQTRLD
jgi:hypothetical protein